MKMNKLNMPKGKFTLISHRRQAKWNVHQEDGKRDGKWDGNGKEKDWKRKSERENREEQEVDNNSFVYFCIIININHK